MDLRSGRRRVRCTWSATLSGSEVWQGPRHLDQSRCRQGVALVLPPGARPAGRQPSLIGVHQVEDADLAEGLLQGCNQLCVGHAKDVLRLG